MGAVKAAYLAAFDVPSPPASPSDIGDGLESMVRGVLPPGAIIPCNLLTATITADFTGGLGDVGSDYEGWAICDGNNGTPNLANKFIRSKVTGSGGSGGSDSGAHTHGLSANGGAAIYYHAVGDDLYLGADAAVPTFTTSHWDQNIGGSANVANVAATPLVGNTDSASATENRPVYYELVFLMKV